MFRSNLSPAPPGEVVTFGKRMQFPNSFCPAMKLNLYTKVVLLGMVVGSAFCQPARAQSTPATSKSDIEYDAVSDDPYDVNKMWLHFFPLYADGFATNFNVGFGAQANYYLKNKFDFRISARKTYTKSTDFSRINGERRAVNENNMAGFRYLEGGATYHVKDASTAGEAKIVVYTKRYSDNKWASTVPEFIRIPAKVRQITGVRLGGYYWGSAANLGSVLEKQKVQLISAENDTLSPVGLYGNIQSGGIYLGGSLATFRNVVIKPKKYDIAVNDILFTGYADILYAPYVQLQTVRVDGTDYATSGVKLRNLGFRAGIEGMFNRDFSWSYGGEIGYRPSLQNRGFYAMFKVGFAFASKMQQQRQSYQTNTPAE